MFGSLVSGFLGGGNPYLELVVVLISQSYPSRYFQYNSDQLCRCQLCSENQSSEMHITNHDLPHNILLLPRSASIGRSCLQNQDEEDMQTQGSTSLQQSCQILTGSIGHSQDFGIGLEIGLKLKAFLKYILCLLTE